MERFVKKVLYCKVYSKGIRLLIFLFIGILLMRIVQQKMTPIPTTQNVNFHAGTPQNEQGVVKLQRSIDRISPTADMPVHERSMSTAKRTFSNTPEINISTQPMRKRERNSKKIRNLRSPYIVGNHKQEYFGINETDVRKLFCTDNSKWNKTLSFLLGPVTSNMERWKYSHTVKCPYFNINKVIHNQQRLKLLIDCEETSSMFDSVTWTHNTSDIYVAPFGNECVNNFIQQCCRGTKRVPNVVHYVWYMREELTFVGFTSMLSVIRFVNPCAVIFHGEKIPHGKYWDYIVNISPNIIHLKRNRPTFISGQMIKHIEHSSDIMRIEALMKYGGIYMDTDTVIVKSLEPLRNYRYVMSNQSSGKMGSAFVMAEKNASFLHLWMDGYRYHYNSSNYTYNAMIYPAILAKEHRDLIHVEYATISRPIDMRRHKIYQKKYATYDWSYIYGIHLYSRIYNKTLDEFTIRNMRSITGSVCRHVLFGNKQLCN